MASKHQTAPPAKSLEQIVMDIGLYPPEAFEFVHQGLAFTASQIHGGQTPQREEQTSQRGGQPCRHVSGQQLCEGLRDYALAQWGLLARAVLRRWNITGTLDFGRIVFALVEGGMMQKTDDDRLDDFKAVFDFRTGFDSGYRIGGDAV